MGRIRTQQIDIQKGTVDLVQSIGPTERQERLAIKRVLNGLAFGDMLQAVTRCDELVKLQDARPNCAKPASRIDGRAGPDHRRVAEAVGRDAAAPRPTCWPR